MLRFLATTLIAAAALPTVQSEVSPLQAALQKVLDTKLAFYAKANVTGLQLSWKSGTEEFTIVAGNAGPALENRTLATDDTFLFGSGAKPLTAAMVMKRWEQGKLDLNATVSHYVDPLFKAKLGKTFVELYGPNATNMTVYHLVAMMSGIPDFDMDWYDVKTFTYNATNPAFTPLDIFLYGATQKWNCLPGDCTFYSSTNFIILGYVLLAVDGKSIDDWASLDQREVAPTSQFPDLNFINTGTVEKYLTVSGWSAYDEATPVLKQYANVLGWTCGNLVGTTRGMAAWMWDMFVERNIVSAKSYDLMTDTRPISFGWGKNLLDYGAGIFVQQTDPSQRKDPLMVSEWGSTIGHGGDTYGFVSDQGFIPQLNATWSWAANSDMCGGWDITCEMIAAAGELALGQAAPFQCSEKTTTAKPTEINIIV